MAVFEGFKASFECDDCDAPYEREFAPIAEFKSVEEVLIAVLYEIQWTFTVKDGALVIFCPTCRAKRQAVGS